MESFEDTKGVSAAIIIEVIGRPVEHLTETLQNMIKEMEKEKGIKVVNYDVKEPILIKDQKDFYSSFAEIELEAEELFDLTLIMFKYMPSHVEIITPEFLALNNGSWSNVMNEIVRRLHAYDEIARVVQVEKQILEKKLREVLESHKTEKDKEVKKEDVSEEKPISSEGKKTKKKK